MKNIKKAVKMYLKIAFNPFFTTLGVVFLSCGMIFFLVVDPQGEKNFFSMLITMSFFSKFIGIGLILISGMFSLTGNKFFASLTFAKQLYVRVHVFASIGITLIIDIICTVVASICWSESDFVNLLIILPIGSTMICAPLSTIGKKRISLWGFIGWLFFMIVNLTPSFIMNKMYIDLPVSTAIVIAVLIYIFGIGITVLLNHIWWKNCDHVIPRKAVPIR
ncbi:MAG: hypothetical protein IJL07_10190 [Lachnospiraceae bacterium]|nr:hypothetical protein [Lachnospiraceae bacterium]